jgi:trimeric autotransporter adhesin
MRGILRFIKNKCYYYCARKNRVYLRMKLKILLTISLIRAASNLFAQGEYHTLGSVNNGCNNKVYTITGEIPETSTIYVGGAFGRAGGDTARYVAKWNESTFTWTSMQPRGGHNGPVRSLLYTNNTLYAAGDFIISDSTDTWHVSKWTGTEWTNLGGGIRGAGLRALQSYNNELYAGGFIDTLSGFNPGLGIEKWNGAAWIALGGFGYGVSGANGFHVSALKVYNGELYVGGLFQYAGNGSISANNIAKWNGSAWSAVGTGTNGPVRCIAVIGSDLYIGGEFTSVNGVPANKIAKYSAGVWSAMGAGFDSTVYSMTSYNGQVYAAGDFIKSGTDSISRIARWNGSQWLRVWSGLGFAGINGTGYCLTPNDGNLYVGGFFTVAGITNSIDISRFRITSVGMNEISENSLALCYPNPTTVLLYIAWKTTNAKSATVSIYSIDGKQMVHSTEQSVFNQSTLDLSSLAKGIYFLQLTVDDKSIVERLVVN